MVRDWSYLLDIHCFVLFQVTSKTLEGISEVAFSSPLPYFV